MLTRTGYSLQKNKMSLDVSITIGIPSYGRPNDLKYLLKSIYELAHYPDEILVVDDNSPNGAEIVDVVNVWQDLFHKKNINFVFHSNESNLGYDKNLKKIINLSSSEYVVFIGNDDIFLPNGIKYLRNFLVRNPNLLACSRSFVRFSESLGKIKILGISKFSVESKIFRPKYDIPSIYFRSTAFFGGLTFKKSWAQSKAIGDFDGTLYYQVYLAACAFYEGGIGYVSEPMVGARVGGVPLFGSAKVESHVHRPGEYTPTARATMWKNILSISKFIDNEYLVNSYPSIKSELKVRMSFHVFEGYANRSITDLIRLIKELHRLKLMSHPVPIALALVVLLSRSKSRFLFQIARMIYQK